MKRFLIVSILLCISLLTACNSAGVGKTLHNSVHSDKWGITLYADDVTPKGMTLKIEQFGGSPSGTLQYGAAYTLEMTADDEWQPVETYVAYFTIE